MKNSSLQNTIIKSINEKSVLLQRVSDNTYQSFNELKEVLREIVEFYNSHIESNDIRIALELTQKGQYVLELRIATDVLIFYMHTNTFQFDRSHKIWEQEYVKQDLSTSYCGIINIYNFLNDSFKYSRMDDFGYLIARVFVNKEKHFFVEGKRQRGMGYTNIGKSNIDKTNLRKIVEAAMAYTLEFDLLAPPYENMKMISIAQISDEINNTNIQTGKRLGFVYKTDDING